MSVPWKRRTRHDCYRRRFAGIQDPTIADKMAKVCLILPSSGADLKAVGAMAGLAITQWQESPYRKKVSGTLAIPGKILAVVGVKTIRTNPNTCRLHLQPPYVYLLFL
jgi:hypothetical protein